MAATRQHWRLELAINNWRFALRTYRLCVSQQLKRQQQLRLMRQNGTRLPGSAAALRIEQSVNEIDQCPPLLASSSSSFASSSFASSSFFSFFPLRFRLDFNDSSWTQLASFHLFSSAPERVTASSAKLLRSSAQAMRCTLLNTKSQSQAIS